MDEVAMLMFAGIVFLAFFSVAWGALERLYDHLLMKRAGRRKPAGRNDGR